MTTTGNSIPRGFFEEMGLKTYDEAEILHDFDHKHLNKGGYARVTIAGQYQFLPSEILKVMDPDAYKEEFILYLQDQDLQKYSNFYVCASKVGMIAEDMARVERAFLHAC
jgi:hypothetical protein